MRKLEKAARPGLVGLLVMALFLHFDLSAQSRYWVASSPGDWSDAANWSTTSGGVGGATVPSTTDAVYFNASGTGDCSLTADVQFDGLVTSSFTGTIDLNGFEMVSVGSTNSNINGGTFSNSVNADALSITTSGNIYLTGLTADVILFLEGNIVAFNGGTYNDVVNVIANGTGSYMGTGGCTFRAALYVENQGSGYFGMGNVDPDVFNDDIYLTNSSSNTIRMAYAAADNKFRGDIYVSNTGGGVYFGENGGTSDLTIGNKLLVGVGGFSTGNLSLEGFHQIGSTSQTFTLTGDAVFHVRQNSTFEGSLKVSTPRFYTSDATYVRTVLIEHTGSVASYSAGGNTFQMDVTFQATGEGHMLMGNVNPDDFQGDLTLNNLGDSYMYIAHNSAGNNISGDLTLNNNGVGNRFGFIISNQSAASLSIGGNVVVNNNQTGDTSYVYLADYGNLTIDGDLLIDNNSASNFSVVFVGYGADADITINGNVDVENSGSGSRQRVYLANAGNVTINGTTTLTNNSSATSSQIYIANTGSATFGEDIVVASTHLDCDGILFGNGGGTSTLATGKTISVGTSYIGGYLYFTNFSQLGSEAISFNLTDNARYLSNGSTWNGDLTISAPRIHTSHTYHGGLVSISKTGASNDASVGGNYFAQDCQIDKGGTGYLLFGNGTQDTFMMDLDVQVTGGHNFYLGYDSEDNFVGGDLSMNIDHTGDASWIFVTVDDTSSLDVVGNVFLSNTGVTDTSYIYFGHQGDVSVGGDLLLDNSNNGNIAQIVVANHLDAEATISGTTTLVNAGAGVRKRVFFGNAGTVTANGPLNITNSSSATSSQVYLNHAGSVLYNDDITLDVTHADCDGIYFGSSTGTGTLATGKTISVGTSYIAGYLSLRNFTQLGSTPQSIICSGTSLILNHDAEWNGDVYQEAGRMYSRYSTYNGETTLVKAGESHDWSAGGNYFAQDLTLTNSGSGYILFGGTEADTFMMDVNLNNLGSYFMYLAYNSDSNYIGGNMNILHNPTGGYTGINICSQDSTELIIDGDVTFNNTSATDTSYLYLASRGHLEIGGDLTVNNNSTGDYISQIYVANTATSSVLVKGDARVTNAGSGDRNRIYFGSYGDLTITGDLSIVNSSTSNQSSIYCNYDGEGTYLGDIQVQSAGLDCDGIYFGYANGSATLAAGKTLTTGGPFTDGYLHLERFYALAGTAQSLTLTDNGWLRVQESEFGGDFYGESPRIYTISSTYNGETEFVKTGSTSDGGNGGNYFGGETTITNNGGGYFYFGVTLPDTFTANVQLNHTDYAYTHLAYNSPGNYFAGNVDLVMSGSADRGGIYFGTGANVTAQVDGNLTASNIGSTDTSYFVVGSNGVLNVDGNVSLNNNNTGPGTAYMYLCNSADATTTVRGNTVVNNSGGGLTKRSYIGNAGDLTLGGTLTLNNTSTATNSLIYMQHTGSVSYLEDILLNSSGTGCDGIYFGANSGVGTLAAGKTISTGTYTDGHLYIHMFSQIGSTAQTLNLTANAIFTVNSSNWDADINVTAPRVLTRLSTYSGEAHFTKTGSVDDVSHGGNEFRDDVVLTNSGDGYFMMGYSYADTFQANLDIINNGSHNMYLAHREPGHYVAGDLNVSYAGNSRNLYISSHESASITIDGNTTINKTNSSAGSYTYIANNGDIVFNGDVDITNSPTGDHSYIYLANSATSSIVANGTMDIYNSGGGTHSRVYVGNHGDITFNDDLTVINASDATDSYIYLHHNDDCSNSYNADIFLESTVANCDGISFGSSDGTGTLGSGYSLNIGSGGFDYGRLHIEGLTQNGPAAQNLSLGGDATFYSLSSLWNGDLQIDAPSILTEYSTYNNTVVLEKTGADNDNSDGGNTFNGAVTFENSGAGYFRPANAVASDYNGDVSYIKTGTGDIQDSYNSASTYSGNLYFDLNGPIYIADRSGAQYVFDGNTDQTITGAPGTTAPVFGHLVLNKPDGDLYVNAGIDIEEDLAFGGGRIISSVGNPVTFLDGADYAGVGDASHVDGPVNKIGNDAFVFPTGNGGLFRPISMTAPSSSSAEFSGTYFNESPYALYTYTSRETSIRHLSNCEYWTLDRVASTDPVSVTLSWDDPTSCGVDSLEALLVVRWDGTQWTDHGNGGFSGTTTSGEVSSGAPITSFSPFTLGSSVITANPLPIELLYFDASPEANVVELDWATETETNSYYYEIERTSNGTDWDVISSMEAAGNSTALLEYHTTDEAPLMGVSYYRLKEVDFDGAITYSQIEPVFFGGNGNFEVIEAYPNPTNGILQLKGGFDPAAIKLYNILGERVQFAMENGTEASTLDLQSLENGVYVLQVQLGQESISKRIVKQ